MKHAEACNLVQQTQALQQISDEPCKPESLLHNYQYVPCCERPSLESCRHLRYNHVIVEGDYIMVLSATMCFAQAAPQCVQRNILLHHSPTSLPTKDWLEPPWTICHSLGTFTYLIAQFISFRHINVWCRTGPNVGKRSYVFAFDAGPAIGVAYCRDTL